MENWYLNEISVFGISIYDKAMNLVFDLVFLGIFKRNIVFG